MPDDRYEHDRRRGVDPLIVEMHGMLSSLVARFDEHVKTDDQVHNHLLAVDARVVPIENFHDSMKTAGKVFAVVGTPVLLGLGTALWAWLKGLAGRAGVHS